MNNYTIGDENEIDLLNEEDRNGIIATNSVEQQEVQQPEEVQDTNPDLACVICLVRPKNTIVLPCRHLKFCKECVDILSEPRYDDYGDVLNPTCPVCRVVFTEAIQPYTWFVILP